MWTFSQLLPVFKYNASGAGLADAVAGENVRPACLHPPMKSSGQGRSTASGGQDAAPDQPGDNPPGPLGAEKANPGREDDRLDGSYMTGAQ
jgi:hypothetical protein